MEKDSGVSSFAHAGDPGAVTKTAKAEDPREDPNPPDPHIAAAAALGLSLQQYLEGSAHVGAEAMVAAALAPTVEHVMTDDERDIAAASKLGVTVQEYRDALTILANTPRVRAEAMGEEGDKMERRVNVDERRSGDERRALGAAAVASVAASPEGLPRRQVIAERVGPFGIEHREIVIETQRDGSSREVPVAELSGHLGKALAAADAEAHG